jgi:hypothetical protein
VQGVNEKEWSSRTKLEEWFSEKLKSDPGYFVDLIALVENRGSILREIKQKLPPKDITAAYWEVETKVKKLKDKDIFLIIGHCPQYKCSIPDKLADIHPMDTDRLTNLLLSSIARLSTVEVLTWDWRPDCRKNPLTKDQLEGTYKRCSGVRGFEASVLRVMNYVTLEIVKRFHKVNIVGYLSFSSAASKSQ